MDNQLKSKVKNSNDIINNKTTAISSQDISGNYQPIKASNLVLDNSPLQQRVGFFLYLQV